MDEVTLEFLSEDRLRRTSWRFYLLRTSLVVDHYLEEERETTRHKFRDVREWSRLSGRQSTMNRTDVPFTDEIARQAKEAFINKIRDEISVGFQD